MDYINYARETNEEGVIISIGSANYEPGESRQKFKLKFYADAYVYVQRINTQRSIGIAMENDRGGPYVEVGNVSIPPNREIPKVGAVVEVRYLYAYPEGSLYQPFYKGVCPDKDRADLSSSLQYKKV